MAVLSKADYLRYFGYKGEEGWSRYVGSQVTYERQLVEALLTAYWNGHVVQNELAPSRDMPRSKADPSHMNNVEVYMMDIDRAIGRLRVSYPLKDLDLADYVMRYYGWGWTYAEIGRHVGHDRSTVAGNVEQGVSEILRYLNGEEK